MKPSKLDVAYKADIVRLTAERLGLSEEKVKDVAEFSFKYLKILMDQTDTASIELPNLGRLHLQFREYFKTYQRQEIAKRTFPEKNFPDIAKMKKKIDFLNASHIMNGRNYHKKYPRFKNTRLNTKLSVEEMEIKQNSNGN